MKRLQGNTAGCSGEKAFQPFALRIKPKSHCAEVSEGAPKITNFSLLHWVLQKLEETKEQGRWIANYHLYFWERLGSVKAFASGKMGFLELKPILEETCPAIHRPTSGVERKTLVPVGTARDLRLARPVYPRLSIRCIFPPPTPPLMVAWARGWQEASLTADRNVGAGKKWAPKRGSFPHQVIWYLTPLSPLSPSLPGLQPHWLPSSLLPFTGP